MAQPETTTNDFSVMLLGPEDSPGMNEVWGKLNQMGISPMIYETIIEARWIEEMKFCGCGLPEESQNYVRSVLEAMDERQKNWDAVPFEQFTSVVSPQKGIFYFVLYVLDAMGLTEHGGNVGGSWLTDKGRKLLAELQSHAQS